MVQHFRRKRGQSIKIGDAIVTVTKTSAGDTEFKVDAPAEVKVAKVDDAPPVVAPDLTKRRKMA